MSYDSYAPREGIKSKFAGKMLLDERGQPVTLQYQYRLPEKMNREEFLDWYVEEGWKKLKEEFSQSQWEEFSSAVSSW